MKDLENISIHRWQRGQILEAQDILAVEEPMELRLGYAWKGKRVARSLSITMRTPGQDFDLAVGFLLTEGIIDDPSLIQEIVHCGEPTEDGQRNVVRVELVDEVHVDMKRLQRHFYTSSSCGVCGKTSLEALATQRAEEALPVTFRVSPELIAGLPDIMRNAQPNFDQTGGLHATGLFDAQGTLLMVREDVGRHNAMDKLIGASAQANLLPLDHHIVVLSGRMSFELIQKAVMASLSCIVAVGAPSSLAVALAKQYNITLVGFTRPGRFNLYNGHQRVLGTTS